MDTFAVKPLTETVFHQGDRVYYADAGPGEDTGTVKAVVLDTQECVLYQIQWDAPENASGFPTGVSEMDTDLDYFFEGQLEHIS